MKVLTINNGYPTDKNPNFATYVKTIDECIKKSGCEVNNMVIKYKCKITLKEKILQYLKFWMKCMLSNLDTDVVYINHLPFAWPILLNKNLRKKRVIIHWHGNDLVGKSKLLNFIHRLISKTCSNYQHIVPSEYFRQILTERFNLSLPVLVSPSGGVDTNIFKPTIHSEIQNKIVLGFASGLSDTKGANLLYELMKQHSYIEESTDKKVTFRVINYGADAYDYIKKFNSTGADLIVEEKMGKDRMPDFFNSISILLMPSEAESLGLVVLEAMACGKPVLTHDICAFPEFVIPSESGERSLYSINMEERSKSSIASLIKIINNYSSYHPRKIVMKSFSNQSVINFYKKILF